ncbi:hypothetical protein Vretifemale_8070, partial [Volvox reticuliferus]
PGRSTTVPAGLFAVEPIEASEFVIEYCGQLIRKPLDDVRQRQYDAAGYADYMFAIDDSWVVDATLAGNAARFINHCCDPNCVARIVEVGGEKRIAIYTLRRIEAGEELHYDYKVGALGNGGALASGGMRAVAWRNWERHGLVQERAGCGMVHRWRRMDSSS